MTRRHLATTALAACCLLSSACAPENVAEVRQTLTLASVAGHGGTFEWLMRRVSDVDAGGAVVSTGAFEPAQWIPAIVPGTVLGSLVHEGVLPEPYHGVNNRRIQQRIPDIHDVGRDYYRYWFRTEFTLDDTFDQRHVWLQLHGINYSAHVWLNGREVGDMKGMFRSRTFDVTPFVIVGGENVLAIDVEPVENPGVAASGLDETREVVNRYANGGDQELGRNVTMLMSAGWDFTFPDGVRDRNTGIWRDIELFSTGPVTLRDPFVKAALNAPAYDRADLTIDMEVLNAGDGAASGRIVAEVLGTDIRVVEPVSLRAGETRTVSLDVARFPQLRMHDPRLWWPVNKGRPDLYQVELSYVTESGFVSDRRSVRFGIREIVTAQVAPDSSRAFFVNGRPVFVRGGNWIPEAMCRTSRERTEAELLFTRQAGLNMLRLWGGGISESDHFFDACDELGIMVWHEFWMTGATEPPADQALYLDNVRSTVKRIRNHPSLVYYVSANERDDVVGIEHLIETLDGTRGYQRTSECCGVHDGSPYAFVNPVQYHDDTASERGGRIHGFNPEYGAPCLPPVECLREMMSESDIWPPNADVWDYLDGDGFHRMSTDYARAIDEYGASDSIEEFVQKGQLVGAVSYKSIWESWNYNKYTHGDRFATGVLFWYHNSPIRQVSGRMWDWSLEPTAALYATQNALQPLHAQYDCLRRTVSVINDFWRPFEGLSVRADVYDLDMTLRLTRTAEIDLSPDSVANDVLELDLPTDLSSVYFVKLWLRGPDGELVSDNFYWLSTSEYLGPWTETGPLHADFGALETLPPVDVEWDVRSTREDGRLHVVVELRNTSSTLAFFNRLSLRHEGTSQLVRPVSYEDNYFSLLPGETRRVRIRTLHPAPTRVRLRLDGWNGTTKSVELQ